MWGIFVSTLVIIGISKILYETYKEKSDMIYSIAEQEKENGENDETIEDIYRRKVLLLRIVGYLILLVGISGLCAAIYEVVTGKPAIIDLSLLD